MRQLKPRQIPPLREWFFPEGPCFLVGMHVIQSGYGTCFVDSWPRPRAVLAESGGNYALRGDPAVLTPEDPRGRITGFLSASKEFEPLLRQSFTKIEIWDRVLFELRTKPRYSLPSNYTVRRLRAGDGSHMGRLSPETAWISKTWGGPAGLAGSGYGWGAFAGDRLVAVACTFFLGERYEELGVVTEPEVRGLGLSTACAGALCEDIQQRGRKPSWSTSPDNQASLRIADKLGFTRLPDDHLYAINVSIPKSPTS